MLDQINADVKWAMSFLKREWTAKDYPVRFRNQAGLTPDAPPWCAQIVNWWVMAGTGNSREEALRDLDDQLRLRREQMGALPRPGTRVPVQFACTSRVYANPKLLEDFIIHALGFGPGQPVFLSDESSINHFGDDERIQEIIRLIEDRYGVVIAGEDSMLIADVLERVEDEGRKQPETAGRSPSA